MSPAGLIPFVLAAKRATYASQGDEATVAPLLPGARQLEWRQGSLLYRDVYVGTARFVGQEIVYERDTPVWSMSYAGGLVGSDLSAAGRREIYGFLRAALLRGTSDAPFRGPAAFDGGRYTYRNVIHGAFGDFWGLEAIVDGDHEVYTLRYAGGVVG